MPVCLDKLTLLPHGLLSAGDYWSRSAKLGQLAGVSCAGKCWRNGVAFEVWLCPETDQLT